MKQKNMTQKIMITVGILCIIRMRSDTMVNIEPHKQPTSFPKEKV